MIVRALDWFFCTGRWAEGRLAPLRWYVHLTVTSLALGWLVTRL